MLSYLADEVIYDHRNIKGNLCKLSFKQSSLIKSFRRGRKASLFANSIR